MNTVAPDQPKATTVSTTNGRLSGEARSLRQRLDEIRALTSEMPTMSDAQVFEAMHHVRFLVDHIAVHGHAEEHVVYPYIETFMSGSDAEIAGLRADHVRLDDLGRAIIEWTPIRCDRSTLPLSRGVAGLMYTCWTPRSRTCQWKGGWKSAPLSVWITSTRKGSFSNT